MKKLVRILTVCVMILAMSVGGFSVQAHAEESTKAVTSGTFGDNNNLEWELKNEQGQKILIVKHVTGRGDSIEKRTNLKESPFKAIYADVDVIRFDGCKLTGKLDYLFADLKDLKTIEVRKWNNKKKEYEVTLDTSEATSMSHLFHNCSSLNEVLVSVWHKDSTNEWNTSKVTDMSGMFYGCSSLEKIDIHDFNTSEVTDMSEMFYGCGNLKEVALGNYGFGINTLNVKDMSAMFYGCSSLENIPFVSQQGGNFWEINTSNVTSMFAMFYKCKALKNQDVSYLNTSKVTNMGGMFAGCSSLEGLDVGSFNTANVKSMYGMFADCTSLKGVNLKKDDSIIDTANVTSMGAIFAGCASLEAVDLQGLKTDNVTDMQWMFAGCKVLDALNMGSFNTEKVEKLNTSQMLWDCTGLSRITAPGKMEETQIIELPALFMSSDDNSKLVDELKSGDYGKTFIRSAMEIKEVPSELYINDTLELTLSIRTDENEVDVLDNTLYAWKSSNDQIATVSENGTVVAKEPGNVTISVGPKGEENIVGAKIELTVKPYDSIKLSLNENSDVIVGEELSFLVKVNDTEVSPETLRWESDNEEVATCVNGKLTGIKVGTATIRCSRDKAITAECTVTVIDELDIVIQPESISVTEYENAVFKVQAKGSKLSYQWQYKVPGGSIWANSGIEGAKTDCLTVQGLLVRNEQQYRCVITDGRGSEVVSDTVTLTVTEKLAITSQPSDQSVEEGENAVFLVTAKGCDLSYQWQYKNAGVDKWFNSGMKGAKTSSLEVVGTVARNGQQYRCIITDGKGNTETSDAVTLTVTEKLAITSQPSDQNVEEGDSAVFLLTAKGCDLSYQWQYKNAGVDKWFNSGMKGAKTSSLEVMGTVARNGQQYRCIITDGKGNTETSNAVTLTVTEKLAILGQPSDQNVEEGDSAVFLVTAKGCDLSYQWQYKNVGADKWFNSGMKGARTNSLTVQGTVVRNGQQYRCIVTDGSGTEIISNVATLTVESTVLAIVSQPIDQAVEEGNNAIFTVGVQGNNASYQWQYKNVGADKWINSGMAGAKTNSLTVQGTVVRNGQQYRCIVTDGSGTEIISNVATLTVESTVLAIVSQPIDQTVEEGNNATFTVGVQGNNASYQWQYKNVGADKWFNSGMAGAKTNSLTVQGTVARNGQQYRCIVTDGSGNTITSNAATLIVK